MEIDIKYIERFWKYVDKKGLDECWNWTGATNPNTYSSGGYGYLWNGTKLIRAHRLSWIINVGPIPISKLVLHKCDNRLCVNPNHLYIGTQSDNMKDRSIKNPHNQGGLSPKFYEGEVWLIRKLYKSGKFTQKLIAKMFKCKQPAISDVINRRMFIRKE